MRAAMGNRNKRDEFLDDIHNRQRNIVFPDTVANETRFWRNLGTTPLNIPSKIAFALLAAFVFGSGGFILVVTYKAGELVPLLLAMLLLGGTFFGIIAFATRRSLRAIEDTRRKHKVRRPW
jgi:hypothetical protein